MKKYLLLFLLLDLSSTLLGQTPKATALADSLFKPGNFKAVITTYEFDKETKTLQDSILARLRRNPEWADKHLLVQIEKGDYDYLKFMPEYGVSKSEFQKMIAAFKRGKQPVYGSSFPISIKKANGIIKFKTSGKASLLNYILINTTSQSVYFDEKILQREYISSGKDYSPGLYGIELLLGQNGCCINKSLKSKTNKEVGMITIGYNKKDGKPAFTLGTTIRHNEEPITGIEFLSLTIL